MPSKRKVNRVALETWVEGYLKKLRNTNNTRSERKFIEKAIVLISIEFGVPCCISEDTTASLITFKDNQLTIVIKTILQKDKIIRRTYRKALFRTLNLLNNYLFDCCTEIATINFEGTALPANSSLTIYDALTNEIILITTALGGTSQEIEMAKKYFAPSAFVKVCLSINSGTEDYVVNDGTEVIIPSVSAVGQHCSTLVKPLQSVYTITGS